MEFQELRNYLDTLDLIHKYAFLEEKDVEFRHEFRKYCEQNSCGNYNENYSCPPFCGSPEEMEKRARRYRTFLIVQTRWHVKSVMNPSETNPLGAQHNEMSYGILKKLKELGISNDAMLAGPCKLCKNGCLKKQEKPCAHDYKIYSCASAYGFDTAKAAELAGMKCWGEKNVVNFFSIFMLDLKN